MQVRSLIPPHLPAERTEISPHMPLVAPPGLRTTSWTFTAWRGESRLPGVHPRNDRRVLAAIAPASIAGPGSATQELGDKQTMVRLGVALREQTRARYPDAEGHVERDGQRIFYEVYGDGDETVFLLPTWSLVHSRHWKMQIPYLARHFRVLAMDGLGNGRSDRCRDVRRYGAEAFARARQGRRRGLHRPAVPVHAISLVGPAQPARHRVNLRSTCAGLPLVVAHERGPLARGLLRVRRLVHLSMLPRAALDQE